MNYVELKQEEMMYIDGGWTGNQVVRNLIKAAAMFRLGSVGIWLVKAATPFAGQLFSVFLNAVGSQIISSLLRGVPWYAGLWIGTTTVAAVWH